MVLVKSTLRLLVIMMSKSEKNYGFFMQARTYGLYNIVDVLRFRDL